MLYSRLPGLHAASMISLTLVFNSLVCPTSHTLLSPGPDAMSRSSCLSAGDVNPIPTATSTTPQSTLALVAASRVACLLLEPPSVITTPTHVTGTLFSVRAQALHILAISLIAAAVLVPPPFLPVSKISGMAVFALRCFFKSNST